MGDKKSDVDLWMSKANDPSQQNDVASDPECPPEVLMWMAKNTATSSFYGLSNNPALPLEAITYIATHSKNEYEKINLFALPNFDKSVFDILVIDKSSEVREEATRWAAPETLTKLAKDPEAEVRRCVAENELTPLETLVELAGDQNAWVRRQVALNERTPVKNLLELAKDKDSDVVSVLIYNKKCPKEVWEVVLSAKSFEESLATVIAENISKELIKMAREKLPVQFHHNFLKNMFMPKEWVAEFLENKEINRVGLASLILNHGWIQKEYIPEIIDVKDINVRERIAALPDLERDMQQILVKDKSAAVRATIAKNPIADPEILMQLLNDKSVSVLDNLKSETYYAYESGSWATKKYKGRESLIAAATGSAQSLQKVSKVTSVSGRSEALLNEVIDKKRYQELLTDKSIGIQTAATLRAAELGLISFQEATSFVSKFAPQTSAPKNRWIEARIENFKNQQEESFLELVVALKGDDVLARLFYESKIPLTSDQILKIAKAHLPITNWAIAVILPLNSELLDEIAETPSWSYDTYGYPENDLIFGQWVGETTSGNRVASYPQAIAARHPETKLETLEKLKKSKSKYVRGEVMNRLEVFTYEDLKKYSKDKESYVRALVAQHPLVDISILEKLAIDSDEEVRNKACAHKLATPEMKATAALLRG
jgi:hypothetical protein